MFSNILSINLIIGKYKKRTSISIDTIKKFEDVIEKNKIRKKNCWM